MKEILLTEKDMVFLVLLYFHGQTVQYTETKRTIQPILYSSQPIRLKIFCTLTILIS